MTDVDKVIQRLSERDDDLVLMIRGYSHTRALVTKCSDEMLSAGMKQWAYKVLMPFRTIGGVEYRPKQ